MIEVTPAIRIPKDELEITFARSGGPGGQNVQKVSSKVLVRWQPSNSRNLPQDVKTRLLEQQRHRLTVAGDLIVSSQRTRDQGRNLDDALKKLRALVLQALHPPKRRKPSRPTRGSRERRLQAKKQRARRKAGRRGGEWEE